MCGSKCVLRKAFFFSLEREETTVIVILLSGYWCLACIYIYGKMSDPLVAELRTVVSCHVGAGN
jgi:hypothetical protein